MTPTPDMKVAALAQCDRAEALFNSLPDAEKAHHKEAGRFFPTSLIRTLIERLQVAEEAIKRAATGSTEPAALIDAPNYIYLIIEDGNGDEPFASFNDAQREATDGIMWCVDSQGPSDILYVRADLAEPPAADAKDEEQPDEYEFIIEQGGIRVASASADDRDYALNEIMNYAAQYEQDGPTIISEVFTTRRFVPISGPKP